MTTESMTREEKRMLFFDMQDNPQKYTDEQIVSLLADEDIKELANDMAMVKRVMIHQQSTSHADVDEAWKTFANANNAYLAKVPQRRVSSYYRLKIAASIVGVVLLSGIALAAIQGRWLGETDSSEYAERYESSTASGHSAPIAPADSIDNKNDSTATKPVIFEDAPLGTILSEMAAYYKMEVVYANNDVRQTRLFFHWNKQKTLQQNVEILNGFDRISITIDENVLRVE